MKKWFFAFFFLYSLTTYSQSVFGYWYGFANVKTNSSSSNYLVELILQPEKNYVKGILNYYFKNSYRSIQIKGDYDAVNRKLSLYNIPVVYYGSLSQLEVDCMMNMQATLRVAQTGANLIGNFISLPDYKHTCRDIKFNLEHNADISKKDSVLKAISEFKEIYQVWQPAAADTLIAANIIPRKVINYVTDNDFKNRETILTQLIETSSDSVKIDIYDNGEIDGDIISLFYNQTLILSHQKLTHKSIHIDLVLDSTRDYNEISMYAENLGLIPPNTALLIVTDGTKKYNISLASDLEKNASIRITRKKN
jgi:hypothetical protein